MNLLKKCISFGLCLIFFSSTLTLSASATFDPGFDPISQSVYLVNTDTDTVLYEKNKDDLIVPASLVKMMTAIVAIESVPEDQIDDFLATEVTAPSCIVDELYGLNASTADIRPNEILSMQDLLYALMLSSACEAASIIADYVSDGDIPAFVDRMNQKAEELGMTNTTFVDPHGLDEDTQRSTAYDMYLLADYAMDNPTFAQIATTQNYTMAATNKHAEPRRIQHTNHMMSSYLGGSYYDSRVKGIKTGTAGGIKNLVSCAESSSYHYLLVTMGAPTSVSVNATYQDAEDLYDWVFDDFSFVTIGQPGEKMIPNNIKVQMGKNTDSVILTPQTTVVELLPNSIDPSAIQWDVSRLPSEIDAPIHQGDVIGEVDLKLAGDTIQTVTVTAAQDVQRSIPAYLLHLVTTTVTSWWFLSLLLLAAILALVYFFIVVRHNQKRRKNRRPRW